MLETATPAPVLGVRAQNSFLWSGGACEGVLTIRYRRLLNDTFVLTPDDFDVSGPGEQPRPFDFGLAFHLAFGAARCVGNRFEPNGSDLVAAVFAAFAACELDNRHCSPRKCKTRRDFSGGLRLRDSSELVD